MNGAAISGLLNLMSNVRAGHECNDASSTRAFAGDLVRLLEKERDLVITIGDEVHEFDPDALVVDSFRIDFGSGTLDLNMLNDGTDGEYTILGLIDCPGDPIAETLQVRLQQA